MKNRTKLSKRLRQVAWTSLLALVLMVSLAGPAGFISSPEVSAATITPAVTGKLTGSIDGAAYLIEVPAQWNGTLLLFSHGLVPPGAPNEAFDATGKLVNKELLARGYALAGSAYSTTGWAVEEAFHDQMALVDYFDKTVGHPNKVIAWGESMGGLISAGLLQKYPQRFAGALPMCGVMGGSVGEVNLLFDAGFVFKTLLASNSGLQLTHITDSSANLGIAIQAFQQAVQTPEGRARLSLVATLSDTADWFDPLGPAPDKKDFESRLNNQISYLQEFTLQITLGEFRVDLERKAGGNPSSNIGVNYVKQLEKASNQDLVKALYKSAGLDLDKDLKALNSAPRIQADAKAVDYMTRNIVFNGQISAPVVTMHNTGDGYAPASSEQSYKQAVKAAGNGYLLRQLYVDRAHHCKFTSAEILVGLQTLVDRIDTGKWHDLKPSQLNSAAEKLGPGLNGALVDDQGTFIPIKPAFVSFKPSPFLRPFTLHK
jgi:pimeloyl-ACP methyl ester carboxylesterase